jgi:RNA polymerase sigma-70 factor (ECF subfamily)
MMTELLGATEAPERATVSGPLEQVAPEFAQVYQAHSRAIFYLCLRMLSDEARAEDATHDVFLKAWRHREQFQGRSAIRTWLYRIAVNHCRNLQQTWAQRHLVPTEDEFVLQNTLPDTATPLRILEVKELGERIQRTLDGLPAEYRLLLLLVADEELSYDAVAAVTGQSADAVRGKLHRARKAFALEFHKTA